LAIVGMALLSSCEAAAAPHGERCGASCRYRGNVLLQGQRTVTRQFAIEGKEASGKAASRGTSVLQGMEDDLLRLATRIVEGKEDVANRTSGASEEMKGVQSEMDVILTNVVDESREDQDEVDRARDAIVACGNSTTELHTKKGGINALSKSVAADRSAHATCRKSEQSLKAEMTTKCDALRGYRKGLQVPGCALGPGAALDLDCVRNLASWAVSANATWTHMKALCDDATRRHTGKRRHCHRLQGKLESAFCGYEAALTSACNNQVTCRRTALAARSRAHAAVMIAEKATKSEFVAAKKIRCFISVIHGKQSEQAALMNKCINDVHDTSHLNLAYPEVPAAAPCDLSPVLTRPCNASWLAVEYRGSPWHDDAPTRVCTPCADSEFPMEAAVEARPPAEAQVAQASDAKTSRPAANATGQ